MQVYVGTYYETFLKKNLSAYTHKCSMLGAKMKTKKWTEK